MNQPAENPIKYALVIKEINHISACRAHVQRNYLMLIYYLATEHFASHALTGPCNKKKRYYTGAS
jgi:hypothetical protein